LGRDRQNNWSSGLRI